jgi:hypothetical protein
MLWNPKWLFTRKQTPTVAGFVSWLETKNPTETYNYFDFEGGCAVSQYFSAIGYAEPGTLPVNYREVRNPLEDLAFDTPHNFGALLERARAA